MENNPQSQTTTNIQTSTPIQTDPITPSSNGSKKDLKKIIIIFAVSLVIIILLIVSTKMFLFKEHKNTLTPTPTAPVVQESIPSPTSGPTPTWDPDLKTTQFPSHPSPQVEK